MSPPPIRPLKVASASDKVRRAEASWNSRDPARIAMADCEDGYGRNRDEFATGRAESTALLECKRACGHDHRLIKGLWASGGSRTAVRFAYEFHDESGQWVRAHGNENWQFAADGLMQHRHARINDLPISESERRFSGLRARDQTAIPASTFSVSECRAPCRSKGNPA